MYLNCTLLYRKCTYINYVEALLRLNERSDKRKFLCVLAEEHIQINIQFKLTISIMTNNKRLNIAISMNIFFYFHKRERINYKLYNRFNWKNREAREKKKQ